MSDVVHVYVPMSNDAVTSMRVGEYSDVGPNMKRRLGEVALVGSHPDRIFWAFGAGTPLKFSRGPTLGVLAKKYLDTIHPKYDNVVNTHDHHYYGSLEEVDWAVAKIAEMFGPGEVKFYFFAPYWHLWRVRLIWLLFYRGKWGKAVFYQTTDKAKFKLKHELAAFCRIICCRLGLVKNRGRTPYCRIDSYGIKD